MTVSLKQANNVVKLIEKLKVVPDENFDYGCIVHHYVPDDNPFKCESTACALGWCPEVFPTFFRWEKDYGGNFDVKPIHHRDVVDATKELFGMTSREHYMIFMACNVEESYGCNDLDDVTKEMVINRLVKYVRDSGYEIYYS